VRILDKTEYYTSKQAAEILGIHKQTVAKWIKSSKLASVKIGGGRWSRKIPRSEIERMASEQTAWADGVRERMEAEDKQG
jgi:excisionase family DNA binding protein